MEENNFKSGYISVVGRPNVGKSTLLNSIIGEKISAISSKPQTTRQNITFIHTDDDSQMIFLDTPGIQRPKNKLGEFMLNESKEGIEEADIITYIVDVSKRIGKAERSIIDILKEYNGQIPIILLINKVDKIKKEELLEIISMYSNEGIFDELIPISAIKNDGIDIYLETLKKYLKPGPMYYSEDMITDKNERFIVSEIIREKGLRYLNEEVPHGLAISIERFKKRKDKNFYDIEAIIYVEREAHKKIIIGRGGSMLKRIGTESREDIENLLDAKVNLQIWVKVQKNWREKDNLVKRFGYNR
ncbi:MULTISPECIES: GTPase Era [Peptoniphilus]|jgi:GTP-binding protein era|uniref:GTPase Era n=1 Tax=Peptoniphilus TaxID=162289 RepID=UPI0008DA6846|nr:MULTISPECIES: GTPase Era [Peptoniphilus]MBS6611016.1 GTPase Era [Peptoniphilus harei]MDU1953985.1 GTPase Era [Peptoniphilus lacydonensis]MDU5275138.1 GTPase Era [Peptoniphilus lacydonensis]MDU5377969.1 GTPase Era [Peptoniphilus lacydonensis]MDU5436763.1 GTPase Era [Peptoniphilus lacydonensis]